MYALPLDIASGVVQQLERLGILQKIDTDLFKDGFSIRLDNLGSFIGQYIDCLLYTSPSPRDLSTSRMPSSA